MATKMLLLLLCTARCAHTIVEVYPSTNETDTAVPLYLALIMSFGATFNSSGTVPGVQTALDLVNSNPHTLPGYRLHYVLTDSQCDHTTALKAFFDQLQQPAKLAVLGAGCSLATEPTADIGHFYNITQVSCASSSSELANRKRYQAYFQMLPTEVDLAAGFVSICKQYGWRHLSIIKQNENIFTNTINKLQMLLLKENISWSISVFEDRIPDLFEDGKRIFFLAMYSSTAKAVLCQAYKNNMIHPRYTYLTYGWYEEQWWVPQGNDVTCSEEEMVSVVEHILSVTQYPDADNTSEATDILGVSQEKFNQMYKAKLEELGYSYIVNAELCFDGVWAIVLALNNTINELRANETLNMLARKAEGLNKTDKFEIEHFSYKNNVVQQLMFDYLSVTAFKGVTGPVSFGDEGIRKVSRLRILQHRQDGSGQLARVEIASIVQGVQFEYHHGESSSSVWPGDVVPYDGVAEEEVVSIALPITIVFTVLGVCGVVFAVICLIFNLIFRKYKLIRLSSPKLNYLIILGTIVMYCSSVLYTIPTQILVMETVMCNLNPRLFSLGYCLCFGTILAKMWRVYYIVTNPTPKRKVAKDWNLAIGVLLIVTIDVILIGALTGYKGGRSYAVLVSNKETPFDTTGELGYETDYYAYVCAANERKIWLGIVYGYMAILQICALFLAFGTRKVQIKGLDDAPFIAAIIYITSIVLAAVIILSVVLNDYIDTISSITAMSISITATVILALLFIPKMIGLYRDPTGESIFTDTAQPTTVSKSFAELAKIKNSSMDDKEKLKILLARVQELEQNQKSSKDDA